MELDGASSIGLHHPRWGSVVLVTKAMTPGEDVAFGERLVQEEINSEIRPLVGGQHSFVIRWRRTGDKRGNWGNGPLAASGARGQAAGDAVVQVIQGAEPDDFDKL